MKFDGLTSFIEYIKYWGQMIIEMLARIKAWKDKNFPETTTEAKGE